MDFHAMGRKELQALCKTHKIRANLTNLEMANRLASLLEVKVEKPMEERGKKSCLKISEDMGDSDEKNNEDKKEKRVKFSPENQTFEFEKTNPRAVRLARRKAVVVVEETEKVVDNGAKSLKNRGRGRKTEQVDVVEAESEAKIMTRRSIRILGISKIDMSAELSEEVKLAKTKGRSGCTQGNSSKDGAGKVTNEVKVLCSTRQKKKEIIAETAAVVKRASTRPLLLKRPLLHTAVEAIREEGTDKVRPAPVRTTRQAKVEIGLSGVVSAGETDLVETAPTRCSRRNNASKDIGVKEIECAKEDKNENVRVTRTTRQLKVENGLNEAGAAEADGVVEMAPKRCLRKGKSQDAGVKAIEGAKGVRTTRQKKGDKGLNVTVSAAESPAIVEQCLKKRLNHTATKRDSLAPGKKHKQASCPNTVKLVTVEHIEDLQADVEAAEVAKSIDLVKVYEAEYVSNSGGETTDAQNMLCSDSGADPIKDLQTAVEVATLVDPSVADLVTNLCEVADIQNGLCSEILAIEDNQDIDQPLHQTTQQTTAVGEAESIKESSPKKKSSTKHPENASFSADEEGVFIKEAGEESDGVTTVGDDEEADTDKGRVTETLNEASFDDAENVLPSGGFQSLPQSATSAVSRSLIDDSSTKLGYSKNKFTRISLPASEHGSKDAYVIYYTQHKAESEPNNSGEGSLTELEHNIIRAETILSNDQVQFMGTKGTVDSITAEDDLSGDALYLAKEEGTILDFYHQGDQISEAENIAGSEFHPLFEFQSLLDTPAVVSNECVNPEVDKDFDHIGPRESGKSLGHNQEAEEATPTPIVNEISKGPGTYIRDRSDEPASFFHLDDAEQVSIMISNELEGRSITKVPDVLLNEHHEDGAVLTHKHLGVSEEKGKNVGNDQEMERVTPAEAVNEQFREIHDIASLFQLESDERDKKENSDSQMTIDEEIYWVAPLFESENEGIGCEISNELERVEEVYMEKGAALSYRETNEVSEVINKSALCMEEAVGSMAKIHSVSPPPVYDINCKLDIVSGLNNVEESICADDNDQQPVHQITLRLEEITDKEEELHLQNIMEVYLGSYDENVHTTLQEVQVEPINMYDSDLDNAESDSDVSSEDNEIMEAKAAVTSSDNFLVPCEPELEDACNAMHHAINVEVIVKVASLILEDLMVAVSEATLDGVAPNSYPPELIPANESHPMNQEYENNDRNETAPDVLDGSEEKINIPSSVEEVNPLVKFDDGGSTVEVDVPSLVEESCSTQHIDTEEKNLQVEELEVEEYGINDKNEVEEAIVSHANACTMFLDSEKDVPGFVVFERVSDHTGEQGDSEILGDMSHNAEDSQLHDGYFEQSVSLTLETKVDDDEGFEEAQIHNGDSSEDSENAQPSSGELSVSPLKEGEVLTSLEKVDEVFEGVGIDSLMSDGMDGNAWSEGSHEQGPSFESNLQFCGHENADCGNLGEENTQSPILLYEISDRGDIELTSYEIALFLGDDNVGAETATLNFQTSETSLLTSMIDCGEKKDEKVDMEQVAGDEVYGQSFESSEDTIFESVVCDKDTAAQCKIFEAVTRIIDRALENVSTSETKKDVLGFTSKICSAASIDHVKENSGNKEFELAGQETDADNFICQAVDPNQTPSEDDTFICGFEDLSLTTSDISLPSCGKDVKVMKEKMLNTEQLAAEPIDHDSNRVALPVLISLVPAPKLEEEAAIPNSPSLGIYQFEQVLTSLPDHFRAYEEIIPDVQDEYQFKGEHEDTSCPEYVETNDLVTETFEHLGHGISSYIYQPMSDSLPFLKEDMELEKSMEEMKSTVGNQEGCNEELEVQPCLPHPEKTLTVIDDQSEAPNIKAIPEDGDVTPELEMYHQHMLDTLKEKKVPVPSEEKTGATAEDPDCHKPRLQPNVPHTEMSVTIINDQYDSSSVKGNSNKGEITPQPKTKPHNNEIENAKLEKAEKSTRKAASATNHKKRTIFIHGTPRRPTMTAEMKENSTAMFKRDHLANATAVKPSARRKALGELSVSRWRPWK